MNWTFTYGNLIEFFSLLKSLGKIVTFSELQKEDKNIILLRHDVDLDLLSAYNLAMLEYREGIRSTFFIRLTGETYNIYSKMPRKILGDLCLHGFEIGLHFDPSIYSADILRDVVRDVVFEEMMSLWSVLPAGNHVSAVSLHNPSTHSISLLEGKFIDAYDPNIWSDKNYISDSCMDFRGKDPFEFVNNSSLPLQILLHPFHYNWNPGTYMQRIQSYFRDKVDYVDMDYQDNSGFIKDKGDKSLASWLLKEIV